MEPARLGTSKRRPRRGSVERPVDLRLVRNLAALLALPVVLVVFTMARPGPLPAPDLPPAFDGATAAALTAELAGDNANRVPGSPGAATAAQWYRDKLALYGLGVREDRWREDVAGLGSVELRNLATVVPGTLGETIVVVAHRDNNGVTAGANSDASGTAALVELARAYATAGTTESARTPLHTLVFLSVDAGAYGSLGAARFASHSPLARQTVAVLSLDGLAGTAHPRLELAGLGSHSPPPALVRTADARIATELGSVPAHPGLLDQLVSLGLPFGFGAQAPMLGKGLPALRLTTAPDGGAALTSKFQPLCWPNFQRPSSPAGNRVSLRASRTATSTISAINARVSHIGPPEGKLPLANSFCCFRQRNCGSRLGLRHNYR